MKSLMKIRLVGLLGLMMVFGCGKVYHVADVQTKNYRIERASYPVDVKVAAMLEPYRLKLEETMNEVIGYNDFEMVKAKPWSGLTNWFTDVIFDETQKLVTEPLDFAIQNYGGIRLNSVGAGEITVGKIYEIMPFDNIAYIMELKGSIVQALFDRIAESGGWPVSKNVYFEIAYGKAKNIKIKGEPLLEDKIYYAVIPDYVAIGGDNMDMLKDCKIHNTEAFIRDLMINHLREQYARGMHIQADLKARIIE